MQGMFQSQKGSGAGDVDTEGSIRETGECIPWLVLALLARWLCGRICTAPGCDAGMPLATASQQSGLQLMVPWCLALQLRQKSFIQSEIARH